MSSTAGWPRLPDEELKGLSEELQMALRLEEEQIIEGNARQLDEIAANCDAASKDAPHLYAKAYRNLRWDKRQIIEKLYRKKKQISSNTEGSSAEETAQAKQYLDAMERLYEGVLSYKLKRMCRHFNIMYRRPYQEVPSDIESSEYIDKLAGNEGSLLDKSGCCVLLFAMTSATTIITAISIALIL